MFGFYEGFEWLEGKCHDVTSQFGEDGLIAAALEKFGETNRWCFEVGASDGKYLSNTWSLRERGWNSVQIEGDTKNFEALTKGFGEKCFCVQDLVGPDSLDEILTECGVPEDLDFGVIDIDGQDYHVWDGMKKFRPRIMLVEYAHGSNGKGISIPALDDKHGQASFDAIGQLGVDKGYTAMAFTLVNLLFVRNDVIGS